MSQQFVLDLASEPDYSATAFIAGTANAEARRALSAWQDWPQNHLALIGPAGGGKSHLSAVWARDVGAERIPATALADWLAADHEARCLVVEDVDRDLPEDALFHAINRALTGEISGLLLTARQRPVGWGAHIPDLVSRLRAMPQVTLEEPDDELLREVMRKQFADRRAPVKADVIEYLLPRMDRSVQAVRDLVDRLDAEALVRHTQITRSLARDVLAQQSGLGDDDDG